MYALRVRPRITRPPPHTGTAGHSKHGLRCIFLTRAPCPKRSFRPYDLVVAQSHEIGSE
jgi:hypothetical protein